LMRTAPQASPCAPPKLHSFSEIESSHNISLWIISSSLHHRLGELQNLTNRQYSIAMTFQVFLISTWN
jgi:hypothetical protein